MLAFETALRSQPLNGFGQPADLNRSAAGQRFGTPRLRPAPGRAPPCVNRGLEFVSTFLKYRSR
jgi:hypothetical protein